MKKKNITIVIILLVLAIAGGYFGLKKMQQSKKGISISNEILVSQQPASSAGESRVTNNQEVNDNQPSVIDNQKDNVTSEKEAVIVDKKVEDTKVVVVKPVVVEEKTSSSSGKVVQKLVSWGFSKSSGRTIKAIIIHTSYNNLGGDVFDFDKVIQEWKDAGVSPHYAIDRDGTIYQLVADNNIAWHAGVSKLPDGTTDVNGASIGVEVINSQSAKFTAAQYDALNRLIGDLKKKYPIKYVLGHDDIAPDRKTDPWGIDWDKVSR